MLTVRSILCPVDFSEQSRQALLWALAIAQYRGAELTVLSVIGPLFARAAGIRLGIDLARADVEPALREFVDATVSEAAGRQATPVRTQVTVGDTSEAILQTARKLRADLIVMGTHGLGGFRKLLLGSTTEAVLRRTEWPVLAVPPGAASPPAGDHPGVQLRKIIVATDFRESATAAMHWTRRLVSDVSGVPLVLIHVVEPVSVPLSPPWPPLLADSEVERVASGQRRLARLSASFPDTHTDCVVAVGRPADTIASLAAEYEAGLVIMGHANAEDAEPQKPGSIAYRVLTIAHAAVVVVPRSAAGAALDGAASARKPSVHRTKQPSDRFGKARANR